MTGTVTSIRGTQQSYCHITDSAGTIYWAHHRDFADPSTMVVGMDVEFLLKLAPKPGKYPAVTNVVALQRKAA